MQIHSFRLAFALLLLAYFPACHADVLVNRTIDDYYGDPVTGFKPAFLSPTPIWADQTCAAWDPKTSTGCTIQPDKAEAFDGTWKSTTYLPSDKNINFTLNFVGISIWVYFILANLNEQGDPFTNTNVNFTLDGKPAGNFSHEPDNSTYSLIYNATVFSRTSLTNSPHSLTISVNDYNRNTFICFDWAQYTAVVSGNSTTSASVSATPSSSNAASSSSNSKTTGIVVGSVIGGLALIALIVAALFWNRKRHLHKQDQDGLHASPTPFLNKSAPPQELLAAGTQPTTEVAGSGMSFLSAPSREALSVAHRRDPSGATSKRAEANYQPSTFSGSNESGTADAAAPGPQVVHEITSLHGQMAELRNQMEQLQGQREFDGSAPPAYM